MCSTSGIVGSVVLHNIIWMLIAKRLFFPSYNKGIHSYYMYTHMHIICYISGPFIMYIIIIVPPHILKWLMWSHVHTPSKPHPSSHYIGLIFLKRTSVTSWMCCFMPTYVYVSVCEKYHDSLCVCWHTLWLCSQGVGDCFTIVCCLSFLSFVDYSSAVSDSHHAEAGHQGTVKVSAVPVYIRTCVIIHNTRTCTCMYSSIAWHNM